MSDTLLWPSKTFLRPLGGTAPVSLTQDLSPEQSADILLLGCGDPRNILFTLSTHVVASSGPRKLDITCCDIEPAILARNILLFTLLEDEVHIDHVWDIFYHFKINDQTSSILTRQSQKLYENANDIETWRQSSYGSFLKFIDTRTLVELGRHWKSYANFPNLPSNRLEKLSQEHLKLSESSTDKNIIPSLAAGMLWAQAAKPISNLFKRYWETGTLLARDHDAPTATQFNPTFVYSLSGEAFNIHPSTFPGGFHLAPAITPILSDTANSATLGTEAAIVDVMKHQFGGWADAFRASRAAEAITLRFYSGEALAFCRALSLFASTGNPVTGVFASAWHATQITLDGLNASASTTFDVIDTSNLMDHVNLVNLLVATRPLLKEIPASQSILYTETRLSTKEQDITQSFLRQICATVPSVSVLLGLAPRPFVSGFTTRSDTHLTLSEEHVQRTHERVAWVDPSGGDCYASRQKTPTSFDAQDLARVLHGLYDKMFARDQTQVMIFGSKISSELPFHYVRETMAVLMGLVKRRVHLKTGDWDLVADSFLELVERNQNHISNIYYQDICLHLHLSHIHTVDMLKPDWMTELPVDPCSDIYRYWPSVPPVLCVVLTVPRKRLDVLFKNKEKSGTPTLEGHLAARNLHSVAHSSVYAIWGKCATSPSSDLVTLEEDSGGFNGKSDLVVMFWASSRVLQFKDTYVSLALKGTSWAIGAFSGMLGKSLAMFAAPVGDSQHVRLLPYRPSLAADAPLKLATSASLPTEPTPTNASVVVVPGLGSDKGSEDVVSFTARVNIGLPVEQQALLDGAEVAASQVSPCTMKLSIANHHHTVPYPYPIRGGGYKLRVARKSRYIEIIVPVSEPFDSGGYHFDRAPIIRNNAYSPWNVHHVAVDLMPRLDLEDLTKLDWLSTHTAMQISSRERRIKSSSSATKTPSANVLVDIKDSVRKLIEHCARNRVVSFAESDQDDIYAVLLVGGLRLDLASFTVVVDAALVSPSSDGIPALAPSIQMLQDENLVARVVTTGHERTMWKELLPSFVERCRTWLHNANCEYTAQDEIPLSIESDENPICTCGQGVGFDGSEWQTPSWKGLLPFATRVAISPLFAVSYLEAAPQGTMRYKPNMSASEAASARAKKKSDDACWVCGSAGKPNLAACSGCKLARYCSPSCQQLDWKLHKKGCRKS
ncbi:hypothetical protein FS749_007223 [Ceratobasidium sp. UAMH 11750]|nr:hypothetical protein FS749_007223 [Ceratobasidium sp. UAMH 11750]